MFPLHLVVLRNTDDDHISSSLLEQVTCNKVPFDSNFLNPK